MNFVESMIRKAAVFGNLEKIPTEYDAELFAVHIKREDCDDYYILIPNTVDIVGFHDSGSGKSILSEYIRKRRKANLYLAGGASLITTNCLIPYHDFGIVDVSNMRFDSVRKLNKMFYNTTIDELRFNNVNIPNAESASKMFYNAHIGKMDTTGAYIGKLKYINEMFSMFKCDTPVDLSMLDDVNVDLERKNKRVFKDSSNNIILPDNKWKELYKQCHSI